MGIKINIMKPETLFYFFGGLLGLATILYFTWEYLFALPKEIKTVMLFSLSSSFFFLGQYLRERDA